MPERAGAEVVAGDPPRFDVHSDANLADAAGYLREHGYVVIKNVASPEEIARGKALLWEWLESLDGGMRRDDVSTWRAFPGDATNGIIFGFGIGQSPFMWHLRGLPAVRRAYAAVWDTDDLLVSFDGCGVFRPPAVDGSWRTRGSWFHTDQGSGKHGFHCVQGLLSLYDATPQTGGLVVVPRSHLAHDEYIDEVGKGAGDYVRVSLHHPALLTGDAPTLVTCRAGDLILWDSRTVHCNTPALAELTEVQAQAQRSAPDLIRAVAYISMAPRARVSAETLEQRRRAVQQCDTSTHWVTNYTASHANEDLRHPRPWVPQLTDAQRKLVG